VSVSLDILNNVRVASPCSVPWEQMTGDDRLRHCQQCNLNVYNFSAMSAQEVVDLVQQKESRLCGRFFRRADGTMITSDCPVGLRAALRRRIAGIAARAAAAILFAAGVFLYLRGGPTKSGPGGTTTLVEPLSSLHRWLNKNAGPVGPVIAGEIYVPPPTTTTTSQAN